MAIPGLNDGSQVFGLEFAKMSSLGVLLGVITPPEDGLSEFAPGMDLFRWTKFAAHIHPQNLLEGK